MIRRISILFLFLSVSLLFAQKKTAKSAEDFGNVEYINQHQLYDYLSFIASDELEGRDTPSRGLDIAAKFIGTHLSRWGYKGAGDNGSYFQTIDLLKSKVIPEQTSLEFSGKKYSFGNDFIAQTIAGKVSAPLVYVSNGYIIKSKSIDPYKGLDVKGKIIVVLGGYPKGITYGDFRGKLGEDYDSPTNYAKTKGALGIMYIPSATTLRTWEKTKYGVVEKGTYSVIEFTKPNEPQAVPAITISNNLISELFAGENTGVSSVTDHASVVPIDPFYFSENKKVSFTITLKTDTVKTQNVVATLEGSDKKLKDEYVAFGAHYDHVGIGTPVNGDSIYNGADDDGSGTVGLMAMAEAFSKGPKPKRSLLFVWHTGEEKGLWGSKYYVQFPTVPLTNIVTMLNIDMIGRSKPDSGDDSDNDNLTKNHEVFSIGSNMMSSSLGKLAEEVNASFLKFSLNYKFDDPNDTQRLFYRSDHYNYAKNGIPIVFYFDGIHKDYHKVTDEIDKIDFDKLMKVTKTIYALGWKIANLPQRPIVDKKFSADVVD